MTRDEFWSLIDRAGAGSGGTFDGRATALAKLLEELEPKDIVAFHGEFTACLDRAYSWDLWGAAYVIGGGCSDDAFSDFRSWLISMGREIYERTVRDPDSLAEVALGPGKEEDVFFEEFAYVAARVYKDKTGEPLPHKERAAPKEPSGEPWAEDDAEELSRRFPRLWERYGT